MFLSGMAMFNHLLKVGLKGANFNFLFINPYVVTYHWKGVLPLIQYNNDDWKRFLLYRAYLYKMKA